jgi:hypothetical protein
MASPLFRTIFFASLLALVACADQAAPRPVLLNDQSNATRIETDQATGAIRFIVNGQEQVRIDETGLHVRQGLQLGDDMQGDGPR